MDSVRPYTNALEAIIARIDGVFDDPALAPYTLSTNHDADVKYIAETALKQKDVQ